MSNLYNEFLDEWSEKWFQHMKNNINEPWMRVHEPIALMFIYASISENINITWKTVQSNPDIPWNYNELSVNPNITWKIIQANPDKPWNHNYLYRSYHNLTVSDMTKPRENFIRKKFQEWFKRSDLKAELMASVWHPRNFKKFKYLDSETFGEEF